MYRNNIEGPQIMVAAPDAHWGRVGISHSRSFRMRAGMSTSVGDILNSIHEA
jgi:hypothetical protein